MTSVWAVLDDEGNPLMCACGQPIGTGFPVPVDMDPRGCYFCVTKWFNSKGYNMPAERKPKEVQPGELRHEWSKYGG